MSFQINRPQCLQRVSPTTITTLGAVRLGDEAAQQFAVHRVGDPLSHEVNQRVHVDVIVSATALVTLRV